MNWITLEHLVLKGHAERAVTFDPPLDHAQLCEQALRLAAWATSAPNTYRKPKSRLAPS